ncbi:hypothetical protein JZ751_028885 [Albula glossodonta]|uniref:Uncharacterized protein n=1 Tax=Albula glossodonta TaxID=121402 RepID=A0A8T2NLP7_9TELE|nr:hypothetical protein JZ751_028885 [Albula glossodonta]
MTRVFGALVVAGRPRGSVGVARCPVECKRGCVSESLEGEQTLLSMELPDSSLQYHALLPTYAPLNTATVFICAVNTLLPELAALGSFHSNVPGDSGSCVSTFSCKRMQQYLRPCEMPSQHREEDQHRSDVVGTASAQSCLRIGALQSIVSGRLRGISLVCEGRVILIQRGHCLSHNGTERALPETQQKVPSAPPPPPPPPPPPEAVAPPEPEEEILGSDDEEQEDPADYCKGQERETRRGEREEKREKEERTLSHNLLSLPLYLFNLSPLLIQFISRVAPAGSFMGLTGALKVVFCCAGRLWRRPGFKCVPLSSSALKDLIPSAPSSI